MELNSQREFREKKYLEVTMQEMVEMKQPSCPPVLMWRVSGESLEEEEQEEEKENGSLACRSNGQTPGGNVFRKRELKEGIPFDNILHLTLCWDVC